MIKCNNSCPLEKFDGCCIMCKEHGTCDSACDSTPDVCKDSINVPDAVETETDEVTALEVFKKSQLTVLNKIAEVIKTKKKAEDDETELKEQLLKACEMYGIKKFESEILNITYVAATSTTAIDTTKAKKLIPDWESKCSKTSSKKAYVKVELKK